MFAGELILFVVVVLGDENFLTIKGNKAKMRF